jgi:methyltransferase-like protein 6
MYGIFRSSESITVFACDCSKDTLEKTNEIISNTKGIDINDRFHPFLMDVSKEAFPDWLFCNACKSSHGKAAQFYLVIHLIKHSFIEFSFHTT